MGYCGTIAHFPIWCYSLTGLARSSIGRAPNAVLSHLSDSGRLGIVTTDNGDGGGSSPPAQTAGRSLWVILRRYNHGGSLARTSGRVDGPMVIDYRQ